MGWKLLAWDANDEQTIWPTYKYCFFSFFFSYRWFAFPANISGSYPLYFIQLSADFWRKAWPLLDSKTLFRKSPDNLEYLGSIAAYHDLWNRLFLWRLAYFFSLSIDPKMPYSIDYTTCLLLASCVTGLMLGQMYHVIIASSIILGSLYLSYTKRKKTPITPGLTAFEYRFHRPSAPACSACTNRMAASESHKLQITFAKAGLRTLQIAGMRTINFAGEEPLLEPGYLGELARYCKEVLGVENISVSTNGALVTEDWLRRYGEYVDILRLSYRSSGATTSLFAPELMRLCQLCKDHGIRFELYTAVDGLNYDEDMNPAVQSIDPHRWAVYKAQASDGDQTRNGANNDAARRCILITDEQFERFCTRHRTGVEEDNGYEFESLQRSQPGEEELWLDEHMRFVSKRSDRPTNSILDVGVVAALAELPEATLDA